jgi:heme exporter protein B
LFFALFAALAGVAIGPERAPLQSAAPAIVWLAAAFAVEFSVADIFAADERDGSLRALGAEQDSLLAYVLAKAATVAAVTVAPLLLAAPVVFAMFGVAPEKLAGASVLLALGAPALVLIAIFAAALAVGLRAGGLFAALIAAPIVVSPLIFGVLATKIHIASGILWSPEALILTALSLFMGGLTPAFSIFALRFALD